MIHRCYQFKRWVENPAWLVNSISENYLLSPLLLGQVIACIYLRFFYRHFPFLTADFQQVFFEFIQFCHRIRSWCFILYVTILLHANDHIVKNDASIRYEDYMLDVLISDLPSEYFRTRLEYIKQTFNVFSDGLLTHRVLLFTQKKYHGTSVWQIIAS